MMKSTIALTVAGTEVSSASFSSLAGEEGWVGEDREWASLEKAPETKLEMSDAAEERLNLSTRNVFV